MDTAEKQIQVLKALGHPIRLKIVQILSKEPELCVCRLNENVEFSQSNLSQHLKILRDASIVKTRKEGQWMWYSINNDSIMAVIKAVENIE